MQKLLFSALSISLLAQAVSYAQESAYPPVSVTELVSDFLDETTPVAKLNKGIVRLESVVSQKSHSNNPAEKPLIFTHAFCNIEKRKVVFVALDDSLTFTNSPEIVEAFPKKLEIESCQNLTDLEKLLGKPTPLAFGLIDNEALKWNASWEFLRPTEENTFAYMSISVALHRPRTADEAVVKNIEFKEIVCNYGEVDNQ